MRIYRNSISFFLSAANRPETKKPGGLWEENRPGNIGDIGTEGILSLDPSGCITVHQCLDLFPADVVGIAWDGLLQGTGGNGEFQCLLLVTAVGDEAVDEAGREGIPAADAIDKTDVILTGMIEILSVLDDRGPAVVTGSIGLAQCSGNVSEA